MTSPSNIADGCAAPDQSAPLPASVDLQKETVITGVVTNADDEAVGGAYVRLLDSTGEFTAEVVTSPQGVFRFFAAPGSWTLRAGSPPRPGGPVPGATPRVDQVALSVAAA